MFPFSRYSQTTPHQLSHRSSSLVFTDVRESRFMTIAESEKALLRADFEADVKYKQLIMEAESILQSMRNSVQRWVMQSHIEIAF